MIMEVMKIMMLTLTCSIHPAGLRLSRSFLEDQDGEGDGGQPQVELERVHPQPLVHARGVAENTGKHRRPDRSS